MIGVLIVENCPLVRLGIAEVLSAAADVRLIAAVGSIPECESVLTDQEEAGPTSPATQDGEFDQWPDVVLLDLQLALEISAFEVVNSLAQRTRVVVVAASFRKSDVLAVLSAGASGYLSHQATPKLLLAAIRTAMAGGFTLSSIIPDLIRLGASRLDVGRLDAGRFAAGQAAAGHVEAGHVAAGRFDRGRPDGNGARSSVGLERLSPRERETLSHVASGLTHSQVAIRMGVTKATVDTYVERIRRKLGPGNKADLVRLAVRIGL